MRNEIVMKGSSWCSSYNVEERGPQSLSLGLNTTSCISSCRSYYYNYCHYSPQSRSYRTSWLTSLVASIANEDRLRSISNYAFVSARLAPYSVQKKTIQKWSGTLWNLYPIDQRWRFVRLLHISACSKRSNFFFLKLIDTRAHLFKKNLIFQSDNWRVVIKKMQN